MQPRRGWYATFSIALATLGVFLLLAQLDARQTQAQGMGNPWSLTADGRSRVAGWSPDGSAVLVNRWGAVVGGGATRQVLSELWSVDVRSGPATRLSENAIHPAYAGDGRQLAYLAFVGAGRWEARTLDLGSGREEGWGAADWRTPPAWVGERLTFARDGGGVGHHAEEGMEAKLANMFSPPAGARVRLGGAEGAGGDWSDGTRLWVGAHPGAEPRPLAKGEELLVLDFAWSPDGQRLAFVVAAEDLSSSLWVAGAAGEGMPLRLVEGRAELFGAPAWSPDGWTLAFSRAPLGAETASASDIWLVNADGSGLRPLLCSDVEESGPLWSPDGHYLAFNRGGDVWVLDVTRPLAATPDAATGEEAASSEVPGALAPLVQQTPPDTIRVIHREENIYRDVPPGQIDIVPFEEYVKRAVPVEVSASWLMETLKVQAVAARTYAWYYTEEHADWDWDVSDWIDYQVMGREDQRRPQSDAAVDATLGQYVAYQGGVIKAFYSAENSSPTRSAAGYDYIQAVDDPVSFGRERQGHGWGMSQWGSYRWAAWHGWGYQQILAHYYTGVTIELPSTGDPTPIGGVVLPWSDHFVTGDRVYIVANASDEASDVTSVGFYGVTDSAALLVTDTVGGDGWGTVWDISALDDTSTTQAITLSLLVADGAGNVQSEAQIARIGLDRRPPVGVASVVDDPYIDDITVTFTSLSATDPSPGSGVQAMAFSNAGWAWEGEELAHQSGEEVEDGDALNGLAWRGLVGVHSAGYWYGPYTYDLPPGYAYRAYFRLKTGDADTAAEVAMLDVVDSGGDRLLGLRRLRGTDFRAAGIYQEFPVDFNYVDTGTMGLEFRIAFRATADLYLDRVLVVGYPVPVAESAQWRVVPGEGVKTVTTKFVDGAGNVSADLITTVTLDTSPPAGWGGFAPEWWDGPGALTCTVRVRDEIAGLDVESARYRFSTDEGASWSGWLTATCTGVSGATGVQTITAPSVAFGLPRATANRIAFQIADLAGHTSAATYTVRSRSPISLTGPARGDVATPYSFTATVNLVTGTVVLPITYTWQATGQTPVVHRSDLSDTASFTWTLAGLKTITVALGGIGDEIGSAIYRVPAFHTIAIGECLYLPLVVRGLD